MPYQVVARLPVGGVERRLSVRLLSVVLLLQAGNHRLRANHVVLRLHARDCADLFLAHGQQRFLRLFLVSTVAIRISTCAWYMSRTYRQRCRGSHLPHPLWHC